MKKAIAVTAFLLLMSGVAFAQTQEQKEFMGMCIASSFKAPGCEPLAPTDSEESQLLRPRNGAINAPVIIPPTDHSLDHALDKPVQTFRLPPPSPLPGFKFTPIPTPVSDETPGKVESPSSVKTPAIKPDTVHRPIPTPNDCEQLKPSPPKNGGFRAGFAWGYANEKYQKCLAEAKRAKGN
jgi:hypothetical protein